MTRAQQALNRVAKWRTVFTGWQLGTRAKEDPEAQAVRDHREATLLHRVELSALLALLIEKGVITGPEWEAQLVTECECMEEMLQAKFPGFESCEGGMVLKFAAAKTMQGWRP